ncbi:MAG: 2-hydroxyglutaryl-CoA dehydratase [Peptoclostridium sp.]|uniref:acyl-CoA dehydratase activase n=1 Tax=Peptoclostridium sp. TaxID=1904860 RepID=UPI00139D1BBF|nr:acyl-CoA dehydratase activase [Peptoclostridium sp.]MZQ75373.1 2-hydroxyglutaryl-CoA dehydratase [Peptoclostridium sp.]
MRTLGIDLGSRQVKLVMMNDGKIEDMRSYSTMSFYRNYCSYSNGIRLNTNALGVSGYDMAVSTGYGKNNTNMTDFVQINEIKAHVHGAIAQIGLDDFVLLDVGGQDVKVTRVEKGMITDIELNEKCAASCGRYLENMANVLEISLDEMASHSNDPIELSSTCAVFAESELIGKIAEGVDLESLCAGVNHSMYKRLQPMLANFKGRVLVVSGGVANNAALTGYLANDYDSVIKLDNPQFNGAIGCCHYAARLASKKALERHGK